MNIINKIGLVLLMAIMINLSDTTNLPEVPSFLALIILIFGAILFLGFGNTDNREVNRK